MYTIYIIFIIILAISFITGLILNIRDVRKVNMDKTRIVNISTDMHTDASEEDIPVIIKSYLIDKEWMQ